MVLGLGIDSIEIDRFNSWHQFSSRQLERIFSPQEVRYCLESATTCSERFAIRFAIREAFFKALSSHYKNQRIPFLTLCRAVAVEKNRLNIPQLVVNWNLIGRSIEVPQPISIFVSCTHTKIVATAVVVLCVASASDH